jgi:hypothetical protein
MNPFNEIVVFGTASEETMGGTFGVTDPQGMNTPGIHTKTPK